MTVADAPIAACDACLRRTVLVCRLAAHIELSARSDPRARVREILALGDAELAAAVAPREAAAILDEVARADPGLVRAGFERERTWAVCRHDGRYPRRLCDLGAEAPAVLAGRGDLALIDRLERECAVTVVGSRRASRYGVEMARLLGSELAAAGVAVVSGMAYGIDSAAHEGALAGGGATVAVLGGGPERAAPRGKARLYARIVERGAVVSELRPGTAPRRWTFPARNRIMAALGAMTVVVEAAERSGSLITTTMAADLGREIGAVPGQVTSPLSAGANSLIDDGATLVRGGADVLEAVLGPGTAAAERTGPALEPALAETLDLVERGNLSADALAVASALAPGEVAAALMRLELLGYVARSGGRYARTPLRAPPAPGHSARRP